MCSPYVAQPTERSNTTVVYNIYKHMYVGEILSKLS